MFVGRKEELEELNQRYQNDMKEFGTIFGFRRIGKSSLLKEFSKDKLTIYFQSSESNDFLNLKEFSKVIQETLFNSSLGFTYDSWPSAFKEIAKFTKDTNKKVVLIIDEYPYLVKSVKGISSILQNLKLRKKELSLIIHF